MVAHFSIEMLAQFSVNIYNIEELRTKIRLLIKKETATVPIQTKPISINQQIDDFESNDFMHSVIEVIEKYLDNSAFDARIPAESLHISLPTLYRKIKQYSNLSVQEITRNIRLKKAAQLLLEHKYPVQEVAEMVGFNDIATFRKRFFEQYHVTPSQYNIYRSQKR